MSVPRSRTAGSVPSTVSCGDDSERGWVGVTCYGCSHGDWQGAGARAQWYPPHGWPCDDDGRKWGIVDGEWYCPDDCARLIVQGRTVDFARMRR